MDKHIDNNLVWYNIVGMSSPYLGSPFEEVQDNWEDHIEYGFSCVLSDHENCRWCAKAEARTDLSVDSAIEMSYD